MELTKEQIKKLYDAVDYGYWSNNKSLGLVPVLRKFEDMTEEEKLHYYNNHEWTDDEYQTEAKRTLWLLEKGFCLDDSWFKKGYAERITE